MSKHPNNNEEWLNKLKNSIEDYNAPLPDNAWQKLEQELSRKNSTAIPKISKVSKILWRATAVAAVILMFLIAIPFITDNQVEEFVPTTIAVVTPSEKDDVQAKSQLPSLEKTTQKHTAKEITQAENKGETIVTTTTNTITTTTQTATATTTITADKNNTEKDGDTTTKSKSEETKKAETKKELTWEEYLNQKDENDSYKSKGSNWLALSAGNNGVGSFDPRAVELPKVEMSADMPKNLTSVNDITYFRVPENLALPTTGVYNINPEYKHKQPISFGITFGKELSKRFSVETGVVYSLLSSDIEGIQKDKIIKQKLHYIGIPIRFNWNFVNKDKYAIYTGAGGIIEKCVYGKAGDEKLKIKSVQGALNLAVGAQYKFTKHVGIYFEPGLSYYLGMEKDGSLGEMKSGVEIKSIHSDNPLSFTLQAGFRFSF